MGETNKNDMLLGKLVMLESEEKSLIRNINIYYRDVKIKNRLFDNLKRVRKDIKKTKFKLRIESEIRKNDRNNNTSKS